MMNTEPFDEVNIQQSGRTAIPSIAMSVVLLVLGVGIGFTAAGVLVAVSTAMQVMQGASALTDLIQKIALLLGTGLLIVPPWIYVRHTKKSFRATFRFHRISAGTLFATLVLIIGLIIVTDSLDRWMAPVINNFLDRTLGQLSPELRSERVIEQMMKQFKFTSVFSAGLLLLAAVIGAGFCEEMLLRGLFQNALETRLRAFHAILLSSAVFALIHLNPWGGLQIFFIAVALGVVAWRTNSIIPTIIMHGLNNLVFIIMANMDETALGWYATKESVHAPVILIGVILLLAGLVMIFRLNKPAARNA